MAVLVGTDVGVSLGVAVDTLVGVTVRVAVAMGGTVGVLVGTPHWFRLPETVPANRLGTPMNVSPPVAQIMLLRICVIALPAP